MDTTATPDRAAIRHEIDAMTREFAILIDEIGDDGWNAKSDLPAYTCGQLAWHLASATNEHDIGR